MAPGRDYVAERLAAGAMTGAFLDGVLAGFIGIHEEGSIGMLEVLPAYRPWLRPGGGSHPPRTEGGRYPLLSSH